MLRRNAEMTLSLLYTRYGEGEGGRGREGGREGTMISREGGGSEGGSEAKREL